MTDAWQPIETAPKEDSIPGFDPLILIGRIEDGRVRWAVAVRWCVTMYGYIQCASRSGWQTDYMPPIALAHSKPRHPGEWIMPHPDYGPTHWMPLPAPPTGETKMTAQSNLVEAVPDLTAPLCERCGARVHDPCDTAEKQAGCQLPDFCFPDRTTGATP